ncbi:MAG TPA: heme ABC exporter ATP-binding protein CcmA [bacterium]|nr:heme ABC exporter ATP-binding protein CcmA [bacterium]HMW32803.1 heme ABC exporter ATP-binding protein CcmA [bacterium]HMW34898.1 heme ABC exporter ATP-binding protein CcmA [bacterium]HMY35596.1 heme ABC exporter ATP-binding protein CcmA [bacterium]HMZ05586.1 heme ABC exporter ATP-binding protein CcmA [bacterium]
MIRLQHISKQFGRFKALDDLSIEIPSGDFMALLGPNGAGKTTTLKLLAGLIRPSSGAIQVDGMEKNSRSVFLQSIGMVSHQSFLYNDLTAIENLRFYANMYTVSNASARIASLLKRVGLGARGDDIVRTFSRGMLQRLSIARALLHEPQMLLLDEPYTGLDVHGCRFLDEVLKEYHAGGHSIVMITHDLDRILGLSNRIVVLDNGRAVFDRRSVEPEFSTFKNYIRN